jgi:hypothetical protein
MEHPLIPLVSQHTQNVRLSSATSNHIISIPVSAAFPITLTASSDGKKAGFRKRIFPNGLEKKTNYPDIYEV